MNKQLILIVTFFLLAVTPVHAVLFSFDWKNTSQADFLSKINLSQTNAFPDFSANKTYTSRTPGCVYHSNSSLGCVSQLQGSCTIQTTVGGFQGDNSVRAVFSGVDAHCGHDFGSAKTARYQMIMNDAYAGANVIGGWTSSDSFDAVILSGAWQYCLNGGSCFGAFGVASTNNNANWRVVGGGGKEGKVFYSNFSKVTNVFGTAIAKQQYGLQSQNAGVPAYMSHFWAIDEDVGINPVLNLTETTTIQLDSPASLFRVWYYSTPGETGSTFSLSCNNKTTWSSYVNNNSVIDCGQQTQQLVMRPETNYTAFFIDSSTDTASPTLSTINITSEGVLGQLVNLSDPFCAGVGCKVPKTNDSDPTLTANFTEAAIAGLIINKTQAYVQCTTTNAVFNICTFSNQLLIGMNNVTLNWSDSGGNKNQTTFSINITDNVPPTVTLSNPKNNTFYVSGVNNTNVKLNFSATDNYYSSFACTLYFNGVAEYSNSSYLNGTEGIYYKSSISSDSTWNVTCIDGQNNENSSQTFLLDVVSQANDVGLYLDGLNVSRKYEFRSKLNITANTSCSGCTVCIDLDAPDYGTNASCGTQRTHLIYNITTLRQSNSTNGQNSSALTGSGINVTLDTRTDILSVSLNVTSSSTITNLNISYPGNVKRITGSIENGFVVLREFLYNGATTQAVNLSYTSRSSQYIFVNVSDNPLNLTIQLRGFDLDSLNNFSYSDSFGTNDNMNATLSINTSSPLGTFDNFAANNSKWSMTGTGAGGSLGYNGGELVLTASDSYSVCDASPQTSSTDVYATYSDQMGDLRNATYAKIWGRTDIVGVRANSDYLQVSAYITDGTNRVTIYNIGPTSGGCNGCHEIDNFNLTVSISGSTATIAGSTNAVGSVSLSSLSPNQPWKFEFFSHSLARQKSSSPCSTSAVSIWYLKKIQFGGVWLQYHENNGTYVSYGNYTSKALTTTPTNISRATLSWTEYKPSGTTIIGYVSSTCNNTLPIFDQVTNGESKLISSNGNKPCVRFFLNSSSNITSPYVRSYSFDIVKATPSNITIDVGDDGTDFTYTGYLNSSNSPVNFSYGPSSGYNTIKISSNPGIVEISSLVANSTLNPITLNETSFENCNLCQINFSFGGGSLIRISDLRFDFLGSWNYTAISKAYSDLSTLESDRHKMMVKHSKFNMTLPPNISYFNVFASKRTEYNLTPYGQKNTTPIWFIQSEAYDDPFDVYIKTNMTLNACLNITYSNTSRKIDGFKLNTSYQMRNFNVTPLTGNASMWAYVDLNNCSARFIIPYLYTSTVCSNCTLTPLTDLSKFNLLVN